MSFRAERTLEKLKLTFDPPPRTLPATVMDKDINNGPPAIERDDSNPFMQAQCSAAVDQNTLSDAATEYHKTRGGVIARPFTVLWWKGTKEPKLKIVCFCLAASAPRLSRSA